MIDTQFHYPKLGDVLDYIVMERVMTELVLGMPVFRDSNALGTLSTICSLFLPEFWLHSFYCKWNFSIWQRSWYKLLWAYSPVDL